MVSEKYLKWYPNDSISFPLDLEKYHRDENGLIILLNSEDHVSKFLQISFSDCEAFREMGEEFKTKFWHEVDIDEDYPLFIVEKSEWIEWFHQQSENQVRDLGLQHYVIWTTENWIEVLSTTTPNVVWIDK